MATTVVRTSMTFCLITYVNTLMDATRRFLDPSLAAFYTLELNVAVVSPRLRLKYLSIIVPFWQESVGSAVVKTSMAVDPVADIFALLPPTTMDDQALTAIETLSFEVTSFVPRRKDWSRDVWVNAPTVITAVAISCVPDLPTTHFGTPVWVPAGATATADFIATGCGCARFSPQLSHRNGVV